MFYSDETNLDPKTCEFFSYAGVIIPPDTAGRLSFWKVDETLAVLLVSKFCANVECCCTVRHPSRLRFRKTEKSAIGAKLVTENQQHGL